VHVLLNAFVLLVVLIAASPIRVIFFLFLLSVSVLDVRLRRVKCIGLLLLVLPTLFVLKMVLQYKLKLMLFFLGTVKSVSLVLVFLDEFRGVFGAKSLLACSFFAVVMFS
jgi:hypothetical protein